jgi:hypothetical protein
MSESKLKVFGHDALRADSRPRWRRPYPQNAFLQLRIETTGRFPLAAN